MVALDKVLPGRAGRPDRWAGTGEADEVLLKKLIEDHHRWTGSLRAREILDHWAERAAKFVKVFPHEYKRALGENAAKAEAGRHRKAKRSRRPEGRTKAAPPSKPSPTQGHTSWARSPASWNTSAWKRATSPSRAR
jgi:glutamate synthase (NADPH/NADH) large chain